MALDTTLEVPTRNGRLQKFYRMKITLTRNRMCGHLESQFGRYTL
ncbi:unnamed protein product [Rodentolepis nana]|uniref:Uncharacterized protein n=1 Tax=Rodentolepis nana TaxID=102285 RepID=A0A3P7S445_RODNA|nr:unnamed protein product [Rodentolepis nana]